MSLSELNGQNDDVRDIQSDEQRDHPARDLAPLRLSRPPYVSPVGLVGEEEHVGEQRGEQELRLHRREVAVQEGVHDDERDVPHGSQREQLPIQLCSVTGRVTPARKQHEDRSEEHTSELQSQSNLVCRLLLEKKKKQKRTQQ